MKLISFFVVLSFLLSNTTAVARDLRGDNHLTPEQIVTKYFEALGGQPGNLLGLTTSTPQEYLEAKDLEVRLYARLIGKSLPTLDSPGLDSKVVLAGRSEGVRTNYLSEDGVQTKTFREKFAYLSRVAGVWSHLNEARVRVELKSRKFERYLAITDFLLYRTEEGWKIFLAEDSSIVNVYGLKNPEVLSP